MIKFIDLLPSPSLARELNSAYDRVFNSGMYIGGKEVEAFEGEWAEYCQSKYCVGVANGHDALALALRHYGEHISSPVFTPWKTCLPTWSAVRSAGFTPTPHQDVSHSITVAVHIYGQITLPQDDSLILIEDCAQAHGATLNGIRAGKFGNVASWSMFPTKNLGALGDAGAITTDDEDIANFVRTMRNYGTPSNPGINSRLDPLQAAFLRVKLRYLDGWNERRQENAFAYYQEILPVNIDMPFLVYDEHPSWHIFAIETDNRDGLASYLREHGAETMVHYPRVPYDPSNSIPEAERWVSRTLSLPIAPHVTPEDCRQIGELINRWTDSRVS